MEPSVVVSFFTQQQRVAREPATTYAGHAAYAVPSYRNTRARGVVGVGAAVCAARCLGSRAARSSIPAQRAAATTSRVVLQVEAHKSTMKKIPDTVVPDIPRHVTGFARGSQGPTIFQLCDKTNPLYQNVSILPFI
eukprot:4784865-Amphidinium_carterae.1